MKRCGIYLIDFLCLSVFMSVCLPRFLSGCSSVCLPSYLYVSVSPVVYRFDCLSVSCLIVFFFCSSVFLSILTYFFFYSPLIFYSSFPFSLPFSSLPPLHFLFIPISHLPLLLYLKIITIPQH
uniref:Uncharacterized protein n=1 Tax=Cacopsylla melanoneura TaxID=428564 RepID=A0A8D8W3N6_9HEMI